MISVVIGTKAQLIKMAPIMRRLTDRGLAWSWIFTGQHRETMEALQADFQLPPPQHRLYDGPDIVRVGQMMTWSLRILWQFWRLRRTLWPNPKTTTVLVHGDTISTVLGGLAGRLAGCRVAHVESGLTSGTIREPFPEELQRRAIFVLASVYFCPGEWAISNLARHRGKKVNIINNTLLDSLAMTLNNPDKSDQQFFGLVNFHRFENLRDRRRLEWIINFLLAAAEQWPLRFVLHPPTERVLRRTGLFARLAAHPNITLVPRLTYTEFIRLLKQSAWLATDGGSNQEECFYLGHPCLLFREVTERQEGLGENVILGKFDRTVCDRFIKQPHTFRRSPVSLTPSPSDIIVDWLIAHPV